jgi:cytochrome P450
VVNPAFRRGWPTTFFGVPGRHLIAELDKISDSSNPVIDPSTWMQRMTLDALALGAFGQSLDAIRNPNTDLVTLYHQVMQEALDPANNMFPSYLKMFSGNQRAIENRIERFNQYMFEILDKKVESMKASPTSATPVQNDHRDLLELMLEAAEEQNFSREDLRANLIIFFLAGHDTTSNALTFALYLMGLHPEIQEKARQEVLDVMGDEYDHAIPADEFPYPTVEQTTQLRYVSKVMKETMRLYPPVTAIPFRVCTTPTLLSDGRTLLPKGAFVAIDILSAHRETAVWGADALEFRPERWSEEEDHTFHPGGEHDYAWVPFGGGQRICLGQQFSIVEQRTVLAMMLMRYRWEVVGDQQALNGNPDSHPGILLHPRGIQIKLTRRSD